MKNSEYISKIENIVLEKWKENPLQQEFDRLFEEMYPVKQFENIYKLGAANMLATFKNYLDKHFCKDCRYVVDEVIKFNKQDREMNEFLIKLLK